MREMKDIIQYLSEEAKKLEIPESITPQQIRKKLEKRECDNAPKSITPEQIRKKIEIAENRKMQEKDDEQYSIKKGKKSIRLYAYLVAAACLCLLVGTSFIPRTNVEELFGNNSSNDASIENKLNSTITDGKFENSEKIRIGGGVSEEYLAEITEETIEEAREEIELQTSIAYPEITYEEIYESMFGDLEEIESRNILRGEIAGGSGGVLDGASVSEEPAEPENTGEMIEYAVAEASVKEDMAVYAEEETSYGMLEDSAVSEKNAVEDRAANYGITNVQTVGVDEGDMVKNDGRFLYQIIYQEKDNVFTQAIQIVDTKDTLTEVKRIEGFENIQEFYIWEDTLIVIENKYANIVQNKNSMEKSLMICGTEDLVQFSREFHEITFYNIENRSLPQKIKTFTLKGRYDSSRITDGYFYGFSKFYASPGEGENDYESYVPEVDGIRLNSSQILLPEENKGNTYLVLVSIDMKNPTEFVETTAIVTDGDMYYVSGDNIYIADSQNYEEKVGWNSNQIALLRFSYQQGNFKLQAEGEIKGSLESSFSMDEYEGNLRMVTTVDEYRIEELNDDRTGEMIGTHVTESRRTNALYVLNPALEVIGKIENLAENERIYSARFMGETGYFVTFRQTDPLFAVDLKEPAKPKILSELKISGFSEYLHFYGNARLLGIGMEADEETGSTEGMKLSMFDISNPEDVQEISKLALSQYHYSEALYNHRAVLISPGANIFGFEAEGYEEENYKKEYLVFSYENEEFVQKLKLETSNKYGKMYSNRGTFIGEVFYLLSQDGSITGYDLNTGEKLAEL